MPRQGENIRKRKDGRWEGRYIRGRKLDRKAIYHSVYGRSYDEVRAKLIRAKSSLLTKQENTISSNIRFLNIKNDKTDQKENIFFYTVCGKWLEMKRNTVRPSTLQKYSILCEKHIIPELGNICCKKITSDILNKFMNILTEKKLSDGYITNICMVLNSILKYGSENNYMESFDPLSYKCKRVIRDSIFSFQEQQRLIRYILKEPDNRKIGVLLCLYTGMRIGEICALKWEDIDTEQGMLTINKTIQRVNNSCFNDHDNELYKRYGKKTRLHMSKPKSESSNRIIPIPDFLCKIIETHLTKKNGRFFLSDKAKPIEPRTYRYHYEYYLNEAGLDDKNFHSLRHTFATHCVNSGFDVKTLSEILGHSNINITMNRYVHPTFEMKKGHMDNLYFEYKNLYSS